MNSCAAICGLEATRAGQAGDQRLLRMSAPRAARRLGLDPGQGHPRPSSSPLPLSPAHPPPTPSFTSTRDIFVHNFANDLPRSRTSSCGHPSAEPPRRPSTPRPRRRRGRPSPPGTSSAPETRSSPPPPNSHRHHRLGGPLRPLTQPAPHPGTERRSPGPALGPGPCSHPDPGPARSGKPDHGLPQLKGDFHEESATGFRCPAWPRRWSAVLRTARGTGPPRSWTTRRTRSVHRLRRCRWRAYRR